MAFHRTPLSSIRAVMEKTLIRDKQYSNHRIFGHNRNYRSTEAYKKAAEWAEKIRNDGSYEQRKRHAIVGVAIMKSGYGGMRKPKVTLPKLNLPPIIDDE